MSLTFPVAVCSSFRNVFAVDFLGKLQPSPQDQNFQLEVRYAHGESSNSPRNEYFLVDFATYDNLAQFTEAISGDVDAAIYLNASY